jgi:ElaB/YqjD/DUF883 family membrane-anchored ribosome-binding protein
MADGFLSGLARRVYDARDAVEDYGRDAGRRLRETADDYSRDARDYGREARDYGRDVGRRARDRGEDARGELRRLWGQLEDAIERNLGSSPRQAARAAGDYASEYAREGRDMAYDVADQIRSATRERPLVAIGIAVAATLIITSLLSSSNRR